MSKYNESTRLAWLAATLDEKRLFIGKMLDRMRGMLRRNSPGTMKPTVLRNFMSMLLQVADEREKEVNIINQIEDIEARHRYQREQKKLHTPEHAAKALALEAAADESLKAKRPDDSWLWLLLFWHMMTSKKEISAK